MKGPLSYVGGKNRLAKHIISLIPIHQTYVEPFAGGAQVLFRKAPSEAEVLNDLDGELVNFYRVCQVHHEELLKSLRFFLLSRKWYDTLTKTPPASLTDIQRASRYFLLQKCSFGGMVARKNFAAHVTKRPSFTPRRIPELIETAYKRLQDVLIESLPYEQVLRKYDRPQTFFYLDPPYFGLPYYKFNFKEDDYVELAGLLKGLTGKFLLSLNDTPEIRRIFSNFKITSLTLFYSAQQRPGKTFKEVLISNYTLPAKKPADQTAAQQNLKAKESREASEVLGS